MTLLPQRRLCSRLLVLGVVVGAGLTVPMRGVAQATPYVPNADRAYQDIDALMAVGWIPTAMAAQRPYSRRTVARFVVEARSRAALGSAPLQPRFSEALARLEQMFAPEIQSLCVQPGPSCVQTPPAIVLRVLSVDGTWADSPTRPILASDSGIDADMNPLLQKNEGRVVANGGTVGGEAVVDFTIGRYLAAQLHPRAWAADPRDDESTRGGTLQEGYVRAVLGGFAADVGRAHVALGYGRDGGPILSDNARGLDLIRVSTDRAVSLPWLGFVGPVNSSALLADLGAHSDNPHSRLLVVRVDIQPHPNVELGATLLNHFGGGNLPPATWRERLEDILLIYPQGGVASDKAFGGSVRVTLPSVRTQLYVDMMTTDANILLKHAERSLGADAVWTGGVKVTGIGTGGRTDLWIEAGHAGVRPYTHYQLTSGLTVDRRIFGDALGPLATGLTAGIDWNTRAHTLSLVGAYERYAGGDQFDNVASGDPTRVLDEPDETRVRFLADWSTTTVSRAGAARVAPAVRVGYEYVTRWAFGDRSRSNLFAQVRLEYRR